MNILVTGGAGFIGSHICDALIKEGHKVVIIDNLVTGLERNINPSAEFIKMDINDSGVANLFESRKFDIVYHQAAQMNVRLSVSDPLYDARNNILGSLNIYEASLRSGVKKVIFASSAGTIYGEQEQFPCSESHPLNPISPYGISKLVNEKYLYYYKREQGLKFVSLRYGNVYGLRQNPHGEAGVVAIFLDKMLKGGQPVINGDGLITRDYIYIDDIVSANLLAINDVVEGIYNVTTGVETDVNTIFKLIKEYTGSNAEEYHGPAKKGEQRRSCCSYSKLEKDHGWRPKTEFAPGLKITVSAVKNEYNKQ